MAKQKPKGRGRPTKYDPAYAEQGHKLALLGATNEQIADFFGVAVSTISKWLDEIPEFSDAVKGGKLIADGTVVQSLYRRANGYSHPAVKIFLPKDAEAPVYADYTERYPPDATSAIFWLKNRQPALWREKLETTTNHKLVDENDQPLAPMELARRIAFAFAKSGATPEQPAPPPIQH